MAARSRFWPPFDPLADLARRPSILVWAGSFGIQRIREAPGLLRSVFRQYGSGLRSGYNTSVPLSRAH
jgi:hypothetical protein